MGRLTHRTHPGCTYFVTTKAWDSRNLFQAAEVAEIIIARLRQCRDEGAYALHEFVVMPNHLHMLLTPGAEVTLERAMQLIKGGSSHEVHRRRGGKHPLWQPGFHEWTVRDENDFQAKREYVRLNPVQAKPAERPQEWLFGSASGRFALDPMPERLKTSGAKAPLETSAVDVGAKAPTP